MLRAIWWLCNKFNSNSLSPAVCFVSTPEEKWAQHSTDHLSAANVTCCHVLVSTEWAVALEMLFSNSLAYFGCSEVDDSRNHYSEKLNIITTLFNTPKATWELCLLNNVDPRSIKVIFWSTDIQTRGHGFGEAVLKAYCYWISSVADRLRIWWRILR